MMDAIQATGLWKSFGEKRVLEDFSADFPLGKTTCIMGESGCGKTTLLHILMGLIRPDRGTVKNLPKTIAPVFQEDRLCEEFSAFRNIRLASPVPLSEEFLLRNMEETGLTDAGRKPVRELSGGMKRRVAILRAVLSGRELLLLDEPFKGLDEATRALTAEYLRRSSAGKTVILVTHDPDEVSLMGGSLLKMEKLPSAALLGKDPP